MRTRRSKHHENDEKAKELLEQSDEHERAKDKRALQREQKKDADDAQHKTINELRKNFLTAAATMAVILLATWIVSFI